MKGLKSKLAMPPAKDPMLEEDMDLEDLEMPASDAEGEGEEPKADYPMSVEEMMKALEEKGYTVQEPEGEEEDMDMEMPEDEDDEEMPYQFFLLTQIRQKRNGMARFKTVDMLLSDVRSMLDEENTENVSDDSDLLPALNRAQDYAANILSRHYESPMLTRADVTLSSSEQEYSIPEDAFEERLEKVEVYINQTYYPLKRIDYRDISLYETPTKINVPYYYCVIGNKYRLIPGPTGTYPARIWYLKDPDPLVQVQGRITRTDSSGGFVYVDNVGSSLTTESDELDSFVNVIDGQSGEVKQTLQIKSISSNKITFKTVIDGGRTSVYGRTISTSLSSEVAIDDYLCSAKGTCVPFFQKPFSNFMIQYAVAEITRKLGGPADIELRVLKELEEQVERSWVGREQSLRVKKRSRNWFAPSRRYFNDV